MPKIAPKKPTDKLGPFTIRQLDAGAALRHRQEYVRVHGKPPTPSKSYDAFDEAQLMKARFEMMAVIKAMKAAK